MIRRKVYLFSAGFVRIYMSDHPIEIIYQGNVACYKIIKAKVYDWKDQFGTEAIVPVSLCVIESEEEEKA